MASEILPTISALAMVSHIVKRIRCFGIESVISGNDAVDSFLGLFVLLARDGLVGNIFDRLRIAFSLHREIDGHGGYKA